MQCISLSKRLVTADVCLHSKEVTDLLRLLGSGSGLLKHKPGGSQPLRTAVRFSLKR